MSIAIIPPEEICDFQAWNSLIFKILILCKIFISLSFIQQISVISTFFFSVKMIFLKDNKCSHKCKVYETVRWMGWLRCMNGQSFYVHLCFTLDERSYTHIQLHQYCMSEDVLLPHSISLEFGNAFIELIDCKTTNFGGVCNTWDPP